MSEFWQRVCDAWAILVYGEYPLSEQEIQYKELDLISSPLMAAAREAVEKVEKDRGFRRANQAAKRLEALTWTGHFARDKYKVSCTPWESNFVVEYAVGEYKGYF